MSGNSASSASSAAAAAVIDLKLGHSYACLLRDRSVITGIVCYKQTAGSGETFYTIDSTGVLSSTIASAVEIRRQEKSIPHLLVYLWNSIKVYSSTNEVPLTPDMLNDYEKTNVTPRTSGIEESVISKYFDDRLNSDAIIKEKDKVFLTRLMNNSLLYLTGPYITPIEIEKKKTPTPLDSIFSWDVNKPLSEPFNVGHYADQTPEQKKEDIKLAIKKKNEREKLYPWYGDLGGGRRLRRRLTRQKKARYSRSSRCRSRSRSSRRKRQH